MDKKPRKKLFYNINGLPFNLLLAKILDGQRRRVLENNKASLIVIEGGVGMGKTTLDIHIADYLNGAYEQIGPDKYKFNPDKAIKFKNTLGMGGQEFISCIKYSFMNKSPVAIYDEAGDFSKRGTLTSFNALINRVFDTYRAFKCVVIISLPSFSYLDNALIDKQIPRLLIRIYDRDEYSGKYKAYDLLSMALIKYFMKKIPVPIQAYNRARPNFGGEFYNLPEARQEELTAFSTAGKFEILQITEIKNKGLLSYSDIGGRVGRSIEWVRKKLALLEIKPVETYKLKSYFDPDVVNSLMPLLDRESSELLLARGMVDDLKDNLGKVKNEKSNKLKKSDIQDVPG